MQIPGVTSALTVARFELKKVFGHSRASHSSRATPKSHCQLQLPGTHLGRNRGLDISANQFPQELFPHSPVRGHSLSSKAGARLEGSVLLLQRAGQRSPARVRAGRTEPGAGGVTRSPGRLQPHLLPVSPVRAGKRGRRAPRAGRRPRFQREPVPWWELGAAGAPPRPMSRGTAWGHQGHPAPSWDAAAAAVPPESPCLNPLSEPRASRRARTEGRETNHHPRLPGQGPDRSSGQRLPGTGASSKGRREPTAPVRPVLPLFTPVFHPFCPVSLTPGHRDSLGSLPPAAGSREGAQGR